MAASLADLQASISALEQVVAAVLALPKAPPALDLSAEKARIDAVSASLSSVLPPA